MAKGVDNHKDYIPPGKEKQPETLSPVDKGHDYVPPNAPVPPPNRVI